MTYPANTKHFPNIVLMLARRLRRRPNIKTTLVKCLVLAGYWYSVDLASTTTVDDSPISQQFADGHTGRPSEYMLGTGVLMELDLAQCLTGLSFAARQTRSII